MPSRSTYLRAILLTAATVALNGCNAVDRLSGVGREPPLTQIQNPVTTPSYRPVSLPMPAPVPDLRQPSSLWRTGARAFFRDQRASRVGDILTVLIEINDSAQINNSSARSRSSSESAALGKFLGLESKLGKVLPSAVDPSNLVDLGSDSNNTGSGTINRGEEIELKVASIVSQVLPNGNLVINGRQEMRVNFEVRELQFAGVVRPEDITAENKISFEKVAEARISYGGRGHITDVQQPRYGTQVFDILFPF